ncbi:MULTISPECIES: 1-acyl-sn-glycerol-3-phosphate acyltransferase [unclassified Acinetobacter]|uniref:1-acyl-sn-glycerol-3-phosphate acyltransferase n=1 Tax=unclassified Acinetobacter TaxID=196816 RepID=UPI0029344AD6|nr:MULTISPECIES: 1-acyl-sn-glycerol-3-phosphate acyltransferase [unclassified Acinetobacter]WOE32524.1 1-acyl-sn-glycerol-3-phosphate acyltransferase [Acinetobacter sp. SAAs470]WOE38000.1 1-acyl-sn-glycerol-3-phosphate acyltransferase [Acinetobacter sp. SAAs474]
MLKKFIGETAFKLSGWSYHVEKDLLEKKQVIIGFEHTSMMDSVLSLALFQIYDIKIHTLIKKELFKGPLKPILNIIGGIAVDRKANKDIVAQMVELFATHENFNLVIAPEGTRAKNGENRKPIRTGFWHIAKAANVPIILMYADSKHKAGGIFGKIYPNELDQDLALIKQLYLEHVGLEIIIPEPKINSDSTHSKD